MKNIVIFKNDHKDTEAKPDYIMKAQEGESWVEVGAMWKKHASNGKQFLGGKLRDEYLDKPGYTITTDSPSEATQAPSANENTQTGATLPPQEENEEDIPF